MTKDKPLRIGVVGCGHWGRNYLRHFSSLPTTRLTAVADKKESVLAGVRKNHPNVQTYSNHRDLLKDNVCDALVVSTVASSHYPVIRDALAAGLDVLAEKPLTLKVQQARTLAEQARKARRILMVAHTFLFNPSVIYLKQCLAEGVAGKVYYLRARRTHLGLVREDVNALWDLAPHDVSIFLSLLGEMPAKVQAVGRRALRGDREDAAFINLLFPSGIIAHICVSWADANKERYLDIVGSKARILFDDLNAQEPIRIFYKGISVEPDTDTSFGEFKYLLRDGEIVSPKVPMQEPLKVLCESFVESVRTRKPPFSDAEFGVKVVEVLSRIQKALKAP